MIYIWTLALVLLAVYVRVLTGGWAPLGRQRMLVTGFGPLTLVLLAAPIAGEICSLFAWDTAAAILFYLPYFCFGVVLFGAFFSIPALIWGWILRRKLASSGKQLGQSSIAILAAVPLLAGGVISGYGIWEASQLNVKHTVLHSAKIPKGHGRIRVAAIADLHLQNPVQMGVVREMVSMTMNQRPDFILLLGDIVDGPISDSARVSSLLSKLKVPGGKYYVYGNHEMYPGRELTVGLLKGAGFKSLIDEGVASGKINLIGVSDAMQDDFQGKALPPLIKNGLFTILMKHRPVVSLEEAQMFDLQLSGHTHGGQILPIMFWLRNRYPYFNGLYKIADRKWIYTSPGVGTEGPPLRIMSPPEITIIDLVSN